MAPGQGSLFFSSGQYFADDIGLGDESQDTELTAEMLSFTFRRECEAFHYVKWSISITHLSLPVAR